MHAATPPLPSDPRVQQLGPRGVRPRWTGAAPGPLATLWRDEPRLTSTGVVLLFVGAASAAGIWLDSRIITGAPAWLKPTKFAISLGAYTLTLAWVMTWIPEWVRTRRLVSWTTTIVSAVELAIIDLQAWRGTTSHFNVGTPIDGVLFGIMGVAILTQTVTTVGVAYALWRQRFADEAMGWALRLGLTLTIVGALSGGLMTQPTAAQLAAVRDRQPLVHAGAHTVGGPDGGPGLPVTGWSTQYGDLRVPHFVGLHAIQALPLVAWAVRRRPARTRRRLTLVAASLYTLAFGLLLAQALRGAPLLGWLA